MASNDSSARPKNTNSASNESARPEGSNNTIVAEGSNNTIVAEGNKPEPLSQRKRKTTKKDPSVQKKPQRGMGVAQLERQRFEESLRQKQFDQSLNLQPPLPPLYLQHGGPTGYVGCPPGYFMGYPTVGGYPNQQARMNPYGFYPVDYSGVQFGNPAELTSMPKPPCCSGCICATKRTSVELDLSLGNPAFKGSQIHGNIEENSKSPAVNLQQGTVAEIIEKEGGSSEFKEYEFMPVKIDNSSSSSMALLSDAPTVEASEASPEATATANDDQDSTAMDLELKL